jgi:hypothetical protein
VQEAEQVQQDDDDDRHAGQPENDISEHSRILYVEVRRRVSKEKRAGTEVSR